MAVSWRGIWKYKCPICGIGDMYKSPFKWANPLDMYDRCQNCGQRFEPELGFYFGAMFISYIISSFYILGPTLLRVFYYGWTLEAAMGIAILISVISYLKLLRVSRSLWLHLMVKKN